MAPRTNPDGSYRLTNRQEMFCLEYIKDLNATQAAVRAGYSAKTSNQIGPANLVNIGIKARIAELQEKRISRIKIEQDDVLRELLAILKSTYRDYEQSTDGNVKVIDNPSNPDADRAIAGVRRKIKRHIDPFGEKDEIVQVEEVEYRLWDKNSAIQKAMKHLGLLEDKLSVKIEDPAGVLAEILGMKKEELP